ncbi:cysteine-rich motor neuron 1 protein-like [Diaphorina citri]|uniref:Cysteine-rich motor neuron 1 protein-like n=1 Tax=Diaphorina citri TaxID=121845 RepID=A0A3Q0IJH6_DIACI|nr:cysteine-rich motor neuron 1 protein-like [Diaphorina citri]
MVRSGTLVPGDCCDVHECINKPGTNCSQVKCPVETVQCPPDSYKLPFSLHPGDCCSKYLGCQCLPSCSQPSCSEEEVPRVVRVGTFTPGSCCPIYECVAKGKYMNESCENGTSWLSADCEECKCERGIKFCSKVECPKLPEACTKSEIGQCCPVCLDCTCREGKVLCYSQQCPAAACSNPRPPEPGTCCPRCAGADEITALVVENDGNDKDCGGKNGTAWREGACISCRCERGHKICYQQECPNSTPCVRSVQPKHACCPTCLGK